MELYINSTWTKLRDNAYMAEAVAYSENGNHVVIYAAGETADEADAKLTGALHELRLIPRSPSAKGERSAGAS
jgi:hypothetical protein